MGRSAPCPQKCVGSFFFFYDFLNYYLRGLGFLALDTSLALLSLPKKEQPLFVKVFHQKKKVSLYVAKIKCKGVILHFQLEQDSLCTIVPISNCQCLRWSSIGMLDPGWGTSASP